MPAAFEQTLMCEVTGLPLPILPVELSTNEAPFSFQRDFHHHFHPRGSTELSRQTVGGRAVRYARGQTIERYLHERYHDIFSGPELPQTEEERFKTSVLACAGVMPRQAIDLSIPGEYQVVSLSKAQFKKLAAPNSIHIESAFHPKNSIKRRREIGKFFANYALKQDFKDVVSNNVIDQFLDPKIEAARRYELGNFILSEASSAAVRSLVPIHSELIKEGYVAQDRSNKIGKIIRKFFPKDNYPDYYSQIAASLAG